MYLPCVACWTLGIGRVLCFSDTAQQQNTNETETDSSSVQHKITNKNQPEYGLEYSSTSLLTGKTQLQHRSSSEITAIKSTVKT